MMVNSALRRRYAHVSIAPWRRWLNHTVDRWLTRTRTIRGLPVTVRNTRPDIDTAHVLERLDAALGMIERYQPWHFRRLARDFAEISVVRYPCRGAYLPQTRTCIVELTFVVNPAFSEAQVAATILHEAMHARLDHAGIRFCAESAARHERFCRRAEVEFGMAVPGGEPVVERALGCLAAADQEVAPAIDWEEANRRVAAADLDALPAPAWLKQAIGRRRGMAGRPPE
jgi:hypothetical protein